MSDSLEIEVVETWKDGRHILTIVDVSEPRLPLVPNERLFGPGEHCRRLFGGEWVGNFETGDVRRPRG